MINLVVENNEMSDETIEKIKLMLGGNLIDCELDDETISGCLEVAAGRYDRGRWKFGHSGPTSWIFDYALANCKLLLGEVRTKFNFITTDETSIQSNGDILVAVALERMQILEKELE